MLVVLEAQPGGRGGAANDLVNSAAFGGHKSSRPRPFASSAKSGIPATRCQKSLAHRRDHPDHAAARQTCQQHDEPLAFGGDRRIGKQLFELVDDDDEPHLLAAQQHLRLREGRADLAERELEWRTGRRWVVAQMAGEQLDREIVGHDLRQADLGMLAVRARDMARQTLGQIVRVGARPEDDAAPGADAGHRARNRQFRQQPGAHQRRLAGPARSEHQQKRRAVGGIGRQLLDGLPHRRVAAVEDRRVLKFVGVEAAERAPQPGDRRLRRVRPTPAPQIFEDLP